MHVYGMSDARRVDRDAIDLTAVVDPIEFGSTFVLLVGRSPNCDQSLNGCRYAVVLNFEFFNDKNHLTRGSVLRFLTTNRADVLDRAVRSRMMLRLEYPDLDRDSGALFWRAMPRAAGLTLTAGTAEELAEAELNGRRIRNLTRLARIVHADGEVTLEQMREVLGCA